MSVADPQTVRIVVDDMRLKRVEFEMECEAKRAEMRRTMVAKRRLMDDEQQECIEAFEKHASLVRKAIKAERADMVLRQEEEVAAQKAEWAEKEDRLRATQLPRKVVLNVGGKTFACSLADLTRIPNTFFSAMFSGRWALQADEDGSFFINRSPRVFCYIMEYLRGEELAFHLLTENERAALARDADFYMLPALQLELAAQQQQLFVKGFKPRPYQGWRPAPCHTLKSDNAFVERAKGGEGAVAYDVLLSGTEEIRRPGVYKFRIRLHNTGLRGRSAFVGVASAIAAKEFQPPGPAGFSQPLWLIYTGNGDLYSGPPLNQWASQWPGAVACRNGDVVGVAVDTFAGTISFSVNGDELGIAFKDVPMDQPLYPCAMAISCGTKLAIEYM